MPEKTFFKDISNRFKIEIQKPLIIAGPCSAESEEQVLNTAKDLSKNKRVNIYRAGIWKPRTRPNTFEGVGVDGLKWLKKAKDETGLLTVTEVASPKHVEECLKHGIDMLWIGARTTSNPFSIQEISNALKGVDIPIFIKNPINPDIDLWIGAIERIANKGIKNIAAIHRGFYPFENTNFRNIPKWEIPIELKLKLPQIPLICDPSHISGSTEYIEEISQKAMDLNMDGLMVETHCCPESAKSDSQQQITPEALTQILNKLKIREYKSGESESILDKYRDQIDSLDMQILDLLSQRMDIVEDIGKYKQENNITIFQLKRWEDILKTRYEHSKSLNLTTDSIKKLLQLIHKMSIHKQTEVMYKKK